MAWLAAGVGFEKAEVFSVVIKEALCEGGAEGSGKDGEVGLKVGVSVGVVFADLVARKVEFGGLIEAGGEAVAGGLEHQAVKGGVKPFTLFM